MSTCAPASAASRTGATTPSGRDAAKVGSPTEAVSTADGLWSKVEVGSVVLAAQPDLYGPGWWEGVVVDVNGDDLTLRWMDTPSEEPFHASRRDIALRHPGAD